MSLSIDAEKLKLWFERYNVTAEEYNNWLNANPKVRPYGPDFLSAFQELLNEEVDVVNTTLIRFINVEGTWKYFTYIVATNTLSELIDTEVSSSEYNIQNSSLIQDKGYVVWLKKDSPESNILQYFDFEGTLLYEYECDNVQTFDSLQGKFHITLINGEVNNSILLSFDGEQTQRIVFGENSIVTNYVGDNDTTADNFYIIKWHDASIDKLKLKKITSTTHIDLAVYDPEVNFGYFIYGYGNFIGVQTYGAETYARLTILDSDGNVVHDIDLTTFSAEFGQSNVDCFGDNRFLARYISFVDNIIYIIAYNGNDGTIDTFQLDKTIYTDTFVHRRDRQLGNLNRTESQHLAIIAVSNLTETSFLYQADFIQIIYLNPATNTFSTYDLAEDETKHIDPYSTNVFGEGIIARISNDGVNFQLLLCTEDGFNVVNSNYELAEIVNTNSYTNTKFVTYRLNLGDENYSFLILNEQGIIRTLIGNYLQVSRRGNQVFLEDGDTGIIKYYINNSLQFVPINNQFSFSTYNPFGFNENNVERDFMGLIDTNNGKFMNLKEGVLSPLYSISVSGDTNFEMGNNCLLTIHLSDTTYVLNLYSHQGQLLQTIQTGEEVLNYSFRCGDLMVVQFNNKIYYFNGTNYTESESNFEYQIQMINDWVYSND